MSKALPQNLGHGRCSEQFIQHSFIRSFHQVFIVLSTVIQQRKERRHDLSSAAGFTL